MKNIFLAIWFLFLSGYAYAASNQPISIGTTSIIGGTSGDLLSVGTSGTVAQVASVPLAIGTSTVSGGIAGELLTVGTSGNLLQQTAVVPVANGGTGQTVETVNQYLFNVDPALMPKTSACLAKAGSNQANNCLVLYVGDSTTYGLGANNAGSGATSFALSAPVDMTRALAASGVPALWQSFMGDGCCGSFQGGNYDARISGTFFQDVASTFSVGGEPFFLFSSSGDNLSFAPSQPTNTVTIYYLLGTSNGTFATAIDGSGAGTQSTTGAAGIGSVTYTASSGLGLHTINITWSSGGNIHILGEVAYNSAIKTLNVLNAGWIGSNTSQWAEHSVATSPLPTIGSLAPTLTLINLGINDWVEAQTLTNYQANMQALITEAKISGDVIIVSPNASAPSGSSPPPFATQATYVAVLKALAISNSVPFVDQFDALGPYSTYSPLGLSYDGLHLNTAGYFRFSTNVADAVKVGLGTFNAPVVTPSVGNSVRGNVLSTYGVPADVPVPSAPAGLAYTSGTGFTAVTTYTVATLPASPAVGTKAYVSDQTTACPVTGGALTGSGAVMCPVFFNSSSTWVGD